MEQLLELLDSMKTSKATNESIRDTLLQGGIQFGIDDVWEKPEDTAAKYDSRAQEDQEVIEQLEKMLVETKG